ncbi:MAG: hypothetical protein L6R43_18030 [Planctomycetes bacterium]|nr:hypothetical protein [Planctomycetota bacterium]
MNRKLGYFPLALGAVLLVAPLSMVPFQDGPGGVVRLLVMAAFGALFAWAGFEAVTGREDRRRSGGELAAVFRSLDGERVSALARGLARIGTAGLDRLAGEVAGSRFAELLADAGFACEKCGREGPVHRADYTEVKGWLLYVETRSFRGFLCGGCSRELFSEFTAATAVRGWLGVKSLLLTLIALPVNGISRMRAPGPLDPEAEPPRLTGELLRRLEPEAPVLAARLGKGQTLPSVARAAAAKTGVSPGRIGLYVLALAAAGEGAGAATDRGGGTGGGAGARR